jgi:hypothetical protein
MMLDVAGKPTVMACRSGKNRRFLVGFEILTAVVMKSTTF